GGVMIPTGPLFGDFSRSDRLQHKVQQLEFRITDTNHQLAVFIAMLACEGDGSLAINQACNIGSILTCQISGASICCHEYLPDVIYGRPRREAGAVMWWRRRDGCSL